MLIRLTPSSPELQKLVAFESVFERIFAIIDNEGSLTHGSDVTTDCLRLLANLLRINPSNQSYFRETGCVNKFAKLIAGAINENDSPEPIPTWLLESRDKNVWGLLAILQLFLLKGGVGTPMNQSAFWQGGVMEQTLRMAFSTDFNVNIKAKALETLALMIRNNPPLQERFGDVDVFSVRHKVHSDRMANGTSKPNGLPAVNVIQALLEITLEPATVAFLDVRLAACDCIKAFGNGHPGIRAHVLRRAIDGHVAGNDEIPNILTVLVEPPIPSDPYQSWLASVLLFHLLFENTETKAIAMDVSEGDAESGEEVVTCIQSIASNLATGLAKGEDVRVLIGYLMLLAGWLFEEPDAVNDFLSEGSSVQSLVQEAKQNKPGDLLPGLCAVLLGILYEFSTKDSPIPRATIHQILTGSLGREQYIDRITMLRQDEQIRDFEVLPQSAQVDFDGAWPDVYFEQTFVDFLKDNFSRLIRAIDREPGFEVSIVANGVQKGVSRELVDQMREQVEEKTQSLQTLESEMLTLKQRFEHEQAESRRIRETTAVELERLRQTNAGLQKAHEAELARIKQINESLQRSHETETAKVQRHHKAEIAGLQDRHRVDLTRAQEQSRAEIARSAEAHKAEIARLRNEAKTDAAKASQALTTEFNKAQEANNKARKELLKQHQEQLRTIDSQLKQVTADSERKAAKVREKYDAEIQELQSQLQRFETQLQSAKREKEAEAKKSADATAKLSKLESKLAETEKKTTALQEDLEAATSRATSAEKRAEEAEQKVAEAEKRAQEAEKKIAEAEKRASDSTPKLADAVKRAVEAETKLKDANKRASDAEQKYSEANKRATAAEKASKGNTKGNTAADDKKVKDLQSQVEKLKNEMSSAQKELKSARTELEAAKKDVSGKEEEKKSTQGELDDLLIVFGDLEAKKDEYKVSLSDIPMAMPRYWRCLRCAEFCAFAD